MKFGVREICDVTFKATSNNQKIGKKTFKAGQPAFFIDSAKTSTLEQATTTVYAQGGKGNSRLIAWEGEKTMTFTVEDALISPQGLAVLSGAGLLEAGENAIQHVHVTIDATVGDEGKVEISLAELKDELGTNEEELTICGDIPVYATKLDGSGAGIDYYSNVTLTGATGTSNDYLVKVSDNAEFIIKDDKSSAIAKGTVVKLDFYVAMKKGVSEVTIAPEDFGGYYYVEADTLFRSEATGKDMAATITIPKAKVQSAMTFTMASSGDPSTFTFTMDAFPGYTYFDRTKKVMCTIQVVGTDGTKEDETYHKDVPADTHKATP